MATEDVFQEVGALFIDRTTKRRENERAKQVSKALILLRLRHPISRGEVKDVIRDALLLAGRFVVGMSQHPVMNDTDLFVRNKPRRPRPGHNLIVGLLPISSIECLEIEMGLYPKLHMLRHQLQQTSLPQRLN